MKIFKAISKSITNLLAVLDNLLDGSNELSIIYKEACYSARQEQALEALSDLKKLEQDSGLSETDIVKLQAKR